MATYSPSTTSINDYTSTALNAGDIFNASYSGAENPIKLPPGKYQLECWGAQGGPGYYGGMVSSGGGTTFAPITSNDYSTYFSVQNGSYYFTVDSEGWWSPNNLGINSTTAQTILTAKIENTYLVEYQYNTETNCDTVSLLGYFAPTNAYANILSQVSGSVQNDTLEVYLAVGSALTLQYTKDQSIHASSELVKFRLSCYKTTQTQQTVQIQGGYPGGNGGYSIGILNLIEPTVLYLNVGGIGDNEMPFSQGVKNSGGFNGGGYSYSRHYTSYYSSGGGGGGASDIRINQNSLYSRAIVAGGGGGGGGESNSELIKHGGGTSSGSAFPDYQATQTAAGTNGSFGVGANATGPTNYNYGPGGGGGGWYGGGASSSSSNSSEAYRSHNGGGSGYVYTSSTASNYPSGCLLNSSYYLTDAQTKSGNTSFLSPTGGNETGHSGNGYIRITVISTKSSSDIYIKTDDTIWTPVEKFYIKIDDTTWVESE